LRIGACSRCGSATRSAIAETGCPVDGTVNGRSGVVRAPGAHGAGRYDRAISRAPSLLDVAGRPRSELARRLPGAALAAGSVVLLSFADGGYFPSAWRAAAVALFAAAALSFVLRGRPELTRAEVVAVASMAALLGWTALSAFWSADQHASLLEAERTVVYLALLCAAFSIRGALLEGTLAGIAIVCAYAVAERLVEGAPNPPDPFEGTLLNEPLGYANALGGLAAIGLAAAIGLLLGRSRARALLAAGAGLFVVTLALTGSRGGWLAAVAGGAVAVALGLRRPRLAGAVAAAAGLALVIALTLPAGSLADDLARHAGDRPWYWHVAWQEAREAPLIGDGAGTFELAWLERRPIPADIRDAHSLYLETLAELGVVGLALLAVALAVPLASGFRSGASAAATSGYVAFLVHAGLDWDWEMPAVTVAGLLCGIALLVDGRRATSASFAPPSRLPEQIPAQGIS
jgi:O-antigen ligase